MAPRKSTSPAPRRRSSRPSLGTTPKKFTYSAIGETTVDADEKAAALAHEAALLKAREARVARDNAEADAAETGPLYLAMGQAAAISAAGEAFCALAIKGESLDAYRLGVFASFSALLTAAIMPWLAVLAQAEMHPLMKTAVDSCVQIPLISASFIAYFEIVLGGGAHAVAAAQFAARNFCRRAILSARNPLSAVVPALARRPLGDPDEADGRLPGARRRRLRLLALRLPPQLHAGASVPINLRHHLNHLHRHHHSHLHHVHHCHTSCPSGPTAFPPPGAEPGGLPLGRDLVLYGVRVRNRTHCMGP
jgi:hypothetical protein